MDNATASVSLELRQHECEIYKIAICAFTIGLVCLFGLCGNFASFYVLAKHPTDKPVIVLLQAIGVSDSLLLISSLVLYVLPTLDSTFFEDRHHDLDPLATNIWPFAMMAHTMTICLTVLVTFTRYCAVCRPHSYKAQTMKSAVIKVFIAAFFSALFNLPRFFEHNEMGHTNQNASLQLTHFGDNKIYQVVYSNIAYFLVMYIIPLLSLSVMNTKLIKALKNLKMKRNRMSQVPANHDAGDDHVTVCIVVIVSVFIFCQTPALVNQIFWALLSKEERGCGHFHFYYTKASDLLVVINSSCNIIIYCMSGNQFRSLFKQHVLQRFCPGSCRDNQVAFV